MNNKNINPEIIVIDDFPPEDIAMLQALYSRDPRSVKTHLEKVKESGPGKFMERFYVGYGHKSIGDCGSTTIFVEGVSMLCAKAIQDWPLYNGQESSTRYLDFSKMSLVNPLNTIKGEEILNKEMALYNQALEELTKHLKTKNPIKGDEKPEIYEKAIKARAFDISRCLLPAGMTTMVAWHTNLRQAADHIKQLRHHPLKEVRDISENILNSLQQKYPHSFGHERFETEEKYLEKSQKNVAYLKPFKVNNQVDFTSYLRKDILKRYEKEIENRPIKTELPFQLKSAGDIVFKFLLDFGSYRDLQRQRSMVAPQPLLTTEFGFHPWYLEQFPEKFRKKVQMELQEIENEVNGLKVNAEDKQYYIPMGYRVSIEMTASLPSAVYISELRSMNTVHPTLRPIAQRIGEILKELVPNIASYCDMGPDEFSVKRGTQDIVEKSETK